MSIKLLLIVSDEKLLNQIYSEYTQYTRSKFLQFYSPKEVEKNNIKYEIVIAQYEYLPLINIKDIPIIVIDKIDHINKMDKNIIFANQPLNLHELYELIIETQYKYKTSYEVEKPNMINYTHNNSITNKNINNIKDNYKNLNEFNNNQESNQMENLQLLTKFYSFEDIKKMNNILFKYATNNKIQDKIIAQASIILDELVYILESLNNNNMIINNNEPKVMMKISNFDNKFNLNLECLIPIENNIHYFISVANNYGNMIESFKRNNSYFFNIHWYY